MLQVWTAGCLPKDYFSEREEEQDSSLDLASASVFTIMEVDAKMSSSIFAKRGYQQESWWFPLGGVRKLPIKIEDKSYI